MKRIWLLISILLLPFSVLAYSNKVIVGGETVGIEVHAQGVYVVGFYKVSGKEIAKEAGFQTGDIIVSIDQQKVQSINDLNQIFQEEKTYNFEVERKNERKHISLKVQEEDFILRTGLYVKDQINGIGTLSYIDPGTNIYGSLGHEIIESTSESKFKVREGTIYKAEVSSIEKSRNGLAGSKNASFEKKNTYGNISLNEIEGIFGEYTATYSEDNLIEVGKKEEIHTGEAIIKTVIEKDKKEEFKINIMALDESSDNKNILFEITDKRLLQKTGGIIQGMSGSPIIQDEKLIGVVNYVIIDEPNKGYGIFITTMLEKGDELIS